MRWEVANIASEWTSILRLLIWLPAMVLVANGEEEYQEDGQDGGDGLSTEMAYLVEEYAPWAVACLIAVMLACYCCYQFRMASLIRADEEQDREEGRKYQEALRIEQTNDINGSDSRVWDNFAQRKQDLRGEQPLSKRPSDYCLTDQTDRPSVDGSPASSLSDRPSSHDKVVAVRSSSLVTDLEQRLPSIVDEGEDQSSVRQQDDHPRYLERHGPSGK